MQKKYFFIHIFLIIYPQAHYLQSYKFNLFLKFCVKILFCKHYFSPLNTFMRKGKDRDPDLWLMDPDSEGPKTCGSPTLPATQVYEKEKLCGNRVCTVYTNWPGGSGWGMYPGCQTVRRTASSHSVWKGGGEVWQPALRLSRITAPGSAAPDSLFSRNSWNLSGVKDSVAEPDQGSGAFLTPGSGIRDW